MLHHYVIFDLHAPLLKNTARLTAANHKKHTLIVFLSPVTVAVLSQCYVYAHELSCVILAGLNILCFR